MASGRCKGTARATNHTPTSPTRLTHTRTHAHKPYAHKPTTPIHPHAHKPHTPTRPQAHKPHAHAPTRPRAHAPTPRNPKTPHAHAPTPHSRTHNHTRLKVCAGVSSALPIRCGNACRLMIRCPLQIDTIHEQVRPGQLLRPLVLDRHLPISRFSPRSSPRALTPVLRPSHPSNQS